jgi:hydrogenase maturation protease
VSTGVLIAGIGNLFLGDDGFGCEVARRLSARSLPQDAQVVDFGIRGFDLTFALLENYDGVILLDITRRGGAPGTLYVVEPDLAALPTLDGAAVTLDLHGMDPTRVLALVRAMGGALSWLRLVACEPASLGDGDDVAVGLSPPVEAAVDGAVALVEDLLRERSWARA